MNLSAFFIYRPVATTLLTAAIAIAGAIAFEVLPVAPLPEVDFPTISVSASLPGASAEIMASSVATPLERQFGQMAGVTEMTSASTLGSTSVTIQFDLSRDIDGAALKGAEEIGFTVFTISISLIAVFIPLLLMGGIVGRLFREFAVTLSTAILVSMIVSLTTTPTMCAYLLKSERAKKHGRVFTAIEKFFDGMLSLYRSSLD